MKNAYEVSYILEVETVQLAYRKVVVAPHLKAAIALVETSIPGNALVLSVVLLGSDVLLG